MTKQELECAILFADISGSTRLYERLGDEQAQECVTECLARLADVATSREGVLIKTIGDEIMCRFPTADAAITAACEMHETLRAEPVAGAPSLSIRIGTHYGPVILEGGDAFGDAVNVGARLRDVAKAGQIITTEETVQKASRATREKARLIDTSTLPGRTRQTGIFEVLWEPSAEVTIMARVSQIQRAPFTARLRLTYAGTEFVQEPTATVTVGRDLQCDIVIPSELASRQHASIEYSRGRFVLTDQSTNGTFVQIENNPEVYLRREAVQLSGSGAISLGRSCAQEVEHLLRFVCE
jgi:class 3 adenylate cyclase